jgi:ATP-dependent helicase HrpA
MMPIDNTTIPPTNTASNRLRRDDVCTQDFWRLQARERRLRMQPDDVKAHATLQADIAAAIAIRARRQLSVPSVSVAGNLPIAAHSEAIIAAIKQHQVIVVEGATGSGKTTQLPKLCLAAGRGVAGMIGCTQPRRIAAKTVARRVASELNCEFGGVVGYQVRFTDQVSEHSLIKFMTDGILLAETQSDTFLNRYDTLIIDEAHERSLNIDFLLGFLQQLLRKRTDLKLIITSATIDTARFAAHFGGAPIFSVAGRTYPVDIRYRPLTDPDADLTMIEGIAAAVQECGALDARGDILIFLPGEREIRDTHQHLARMKLAHTDIVPLYARLSALEQDRVFAPGPGRRIVLATNVAETSITVPRIAFVIDPGVARISRYSHRAKVQRLHIEPISQASANQRAGRCGRVSAGVCFRLYDEDDFARRDAFTDPEILRSSLAGVILRMLRLNLGDPAKFPFVDPPSERAIGDGYQLLHELGAIDERRKLTALGKQMGEWPLDVRYARLILAASEQQCLAEMLVLTAFLSIQDPRERPMETRAAADAAHNEFADPHSDFASILRLWEAYQTQHEVLSQSALREWCKRQFLSFMRMREWRELHRQLLIQAREQSLAMNTSAASFEALHKALLSAFATQVAMKDEKALYLATRSRKVQIFPGSFLAKSAPKWVMAATLLDTQKLYALTCAKIDPAWIEPAARHLLKYRHYDPHWDAHSGRVMGFEDASLLGLPIVLKRRVQFEPIDARECRKLFLRHALVHGDIKAEHRLLRHNASVRLDAQRKEEKLRRRGLLKDDEEIAAWFDERVPADIVSAPAFMQWLRKAPRDVEDRLRLHINDLVTPDASADLYSSFPDTWQVGALSLPLRYSFAPGGERDGVCVQLALGQLGSMSAARLTWLVPGLLAEKVAFLIKSLTKNLRRNFVPVPDFARAFLQTHAACDTPLTQILAEYLQKISGVALSVSDFNEEDIPAHLIMQIQLCDDAAQPLALTRDLPALQREFALRAKQAFAAKVDALYQRDHLRDWPDVDLPASIASADGTLAYPALQVTAQGVGLHVFANAAEAQSSHAQGLNALLQLALSESLTYWHKHLPLSHRAVIQYASVGSAQSLRADIVLAALHRRLEGRANSIRSRDDWRSLLAQLRDGLGQTANDIAHTVEHILQRAADIRPHLDAKIIGFAKANLDDAKAHLAQLLRAGFVRTSASAELERIPRYLEGLRIRLQRLHHNPGADQSKLLQLQPFLRLYDDAMAAHSAESLSDLRASIEEFRISLFAPELGTLETVSPKRLHKMFERLQKSMESN